jgi:hypothetical protein
LRLDWTLLSKLSPDPLTDPWVESLAATEEGSDLVSYLAICAVDAETEIAGLRGFYGLAPSWLHASCDDVCQRWTSACLLAHTNMLEKPVEIGLVGAHPALPGPRPGFHYQEGAYYGNLFHSALYACVGHSVLPFLMSQSMPQPGQTRADTAINLMEGRMCGLYDPACGEHVTGFCGEEREVAGTPACEVDPGSKGWFEHCHTGPRFEPYPRPSPTIDEVITVYLNR